MTTVHSATQTLIRCGSFVLLLTLSSGLLRADSLPLGITAAAADLYSASGALCTNSGVSSAFCSSGDAVSNAVVTNSLGGMASVSLGATASAGAAITEYFVGIEGPAGINVPVIITGSANTQDNGDLYGASYAAYYIYQGSSTGATFFARYFASSTACPYLTYVGYPCLPSGDFTLNTTITSGSVFFIALEAAAGGTNASATIDPLITIDPSFAQASEFTLVGNPGVFPPPAAAVPEPALFAFVVAGFAALLATAKRIPYRS